MRKFDLSLFRQLNEEYAAHPLVPKPRTLTGSSLTEQAERRLGQVEKHIDLEGKRVLEIGCGRGQTARVLADKYGCEVVAVDIVEYPDWGSLTDAKVRFVQRDLATDDTADLGKFDAVLSFVVLEHVLHPYGMLSAIESLLAPGGRTYLSANLHRGPSASHRYREVFFPWPHLLFTDEVFAQFYAEVHPKKPPKVASWVNKLTSAHYHTYFDLIGFTRHKVWLSVPTFDEQFYDRFCDELARYPRFDLAHNFIYAVLGPQSDRQESDLVEELRQTQARLTRAETRLSKMQLELNAPRAAANG